MFIWVRLKETISVVLLMANDPTGLRFKEPMIHPRGSEISIMV